MNKNQNFIIGKISLPERSNWTCVFCDEFRLTPKLNKEPNWFHRKMQEICFGVKWIKNESKVVT